MANITSIGGNPIVPVAVQPNSVTDAMLVQTGGVLDTIQAIYGGTQTYPKADALTEFETFSTSKGYIVQGLTVGVSKLSNIITTSLSGAYALRIPLDGMDSITYPVFKSASNLGCFIFDENDVILWMHSEASLDTGSLKTINVPSAASWMLLSISSSLAALDWSVTLHSDSNLTQLRTDVDAVADEVSLIVGKTVTKAEAIAKDELYSTGMLYSAGTSAQVGMTEISELLSSGTSAQAHNYKVSLGGIKAISYPVFKTSQTYGSFIFDASDVLLWKHYEQELDTGSLKTVNVPDGAAYMLLSLSESLYTSDWHYVLYSMRQEAEGEAIETPFEDTNRNMCLAAIKTDILDSKIPYHRGFLFHKFKNNDNSLWYGTGLDHINEIGTPAFDPTLMRLAVSPKDGRVIAVQRDTRNGIWVWDGETTTHLDGFTTNPQAWLYNSGVDFINDGSGNEYCVFAEYTSSPSSSLVLNVWRGAYPYTSESDWSIVMSQTSGNVDIGHFHMVRRDPWTDILYCTSGDDSSTSKWWYSTDYGATWTLLTDGGTSGFESSVCRTINFVFTEDYVYWATDYGTNHCLNRIERDVDTGLLDVSTRTKLCDLPAGHATNSLCYVESPHGLFMYERVDSVFSEHFGEPVQMLFWDLDASQLDTVVTLPLVNGSTWGGSRGKCYVNYTNTRQPLPAMGFSIDTPCIFDLVCDDVTKVGTIAYNVGSGQVTTVDY